MFNFFLENMHVNVMINDKNLKFRCIFLFLTDILVSAIFASHTSQFFEIKSLLDRDVAQILQYGTFSVSIHLATICTIERFH